MSWKTIVRILKYCRKGLLLITGVTIVAGVATDKMYPGTDGTGMFFVLVFGGALVSVFLVQVAIALLERLPPEARAANSFPHQMPADPRTLENKSFDALWGANAILRFIWAGIIFLIVCLRIPHTGAVPLSLVAVTAVLAAFFAAYPIARITFQEDGIRFESACYSSFGFGRNIFVAYGDASARRTRFLGNRWIRFYDNGKRVYFLNARTWVWQDLAIVEELSRRIPHDRVE
jgi:hypothetical protein